MTPTTPPGSDNGGRKRRYSEDFSDDDCSSPKSSPVDDDKRAHHNELERRRRDHIKDFFLNLKANIPLLDGEKSSRALILKRAVDYINLLQTQTKEYKTEIEELKRRNEALVQQASGLHLKPFFNSMQLQTGVSASTQPMLTVAAHATTSAFKLGPVNSGVQPIIAPQSSGEFQPYGTYCRSTPASPQTLNTSPVQSNPVLLANLSSLFLQNPGLLSLQQPNANSSFESLTPPSSAPYSSELADAQARILASSLAMRERQFAAAVGAAQQL